MIVSMAVYNEEALLGAALDSITNASRDGQVSRVCIFDGAWRGGRDGVHRFGDLPASSDATRAIAFSWAQSQPVPLWWFGAEQIVALTDVDGFWPSQEAKRTALFEEVGADLDEWILVLDADETLHGQLPPPAVLDQLQAVAAHLSVRCVGGNDLPGIRGEWPHGDYSADHKPELRFFRYADDLDCLYPGGYMRAGRLIEAYADAAGTPALPVIDGVTMDHHGAARSPERIAQKIAYYEAEHPERERWQRAVSKT